jgi:hypothetical protein
VTAFKLSLPGFALGSRRGSGPREAQKTAAARSRVEPLPPILALEGDPDPSLRRVIEDLADRLGASICPFDGLPALAADPDFDAVVAVVLTRPRCPLDLQKTVRDARALLGDRPLAVFAPQPLSSSLAGAMPLDPAFIAPPVTVERLLFALEPDRAARV